MNELLINGPFIENASYVQILHLI